VDGEERGDGTVDIAMEGNERQRGEKGSALFAVAFGALPMVVWNGRGGEGVEGDEEL
jgi:hypothetical protein